jgi:asparagine synthase (glutamine-hydrolysing)
LDECVKIRLVSDVPLGVFLSGGIDSSTIVGLMSKFAGERRVKTFCVGYQDKQASEMEYARLVAKKFNTDHYEFCLEPTDFYSFIPQLVWYFDEPIVEPAAIPLYFISKLAREHVTVLLSGEGADELFGGYPIYKYMAFWTRIGEFLVYFEERLLIRCYLVLLVQRKKARNISRGLNCRWNNVISEFQRS